MRAFGASGAAVDAYLHHRRLVARVDRPAGADVQRPRRRGGDLLDEVVHPAGADVECEGDAEAVLPRVEAATEGELARTDRVVPEAVVAVEIERVADVALAVHRSADVPLDEGADALVDEERFPTEREVVDVVGAIDAETVAIDAGDGGAASGLDVGDDVAGVVERVGDVGAEAEGERLGQAAQIGGAEPAELGAGAAAVETDRAAAVDQPKLRCAAEVEPGEHVTEGLHAQVGVAEDLEQLGAVGSVRCWRWR